MSSAGLVPASNRMHSSELFLEGLEAAGCRVTGADRIAGIEAAVAATDPPDILLVHWAERVFAKSANRWQAMAGIWRLLRAARRRPEMRLVWMVHNIAPHDARPFQRLVWPAYTAALARRADGFLTLAPDTVDQVRRALPGLAAKPELGLWHPAYPDAGLAAAEQAEARRSFGFSPGELVLGYCGQISPYKGLEELVAAFGRAPSARLRLLLAGLPRRDRPRANALFGAIESAARADPRIVLRLEDLTPAAFRDSLGACDVVVAPLRDYLHSGSIVHALSAGRPVLTPATPFSKSYQALLGADWVRLYDGPLTPDLLTSQQPAPGAQADLSALAAPAVGAAAAAFLRDLAAHPRFSSD